MTLLYYWWNWLLLNRYQFFLIDNLWRLLSSFHTKNQNLNVFLHPHNYHLPSKTAFLDYTLEQLDLFCAEDDFWANFRRGQVEEMYSKFSRDGSGVK